MNPSKIEAREFYGKVRQAVSTKSMAGPKFTHSSGQNGCHSSVSNFSHAGEGKDLESRFIS